MLRTFAILAMSLVSVTVYAGPVASPDVPQAPVQLSAAQMDAVTAGLALLLPAVQNVDWAAAAQSRAAGFVPIYKFEVHNQGPSTVPAHPPPFVVAGGGVGVRP